MNCPPCTSTETKEQAKNTSLGYRTFRCSTCKRTFNERTGTAFNFLECPTDLVLLVVLWRLRYTVGLRDLAEMVLDLKILLGNVPVCQFSWEMGDTPPNTQTPGMSAGCLCVRPCNACRLTPLLPHYPRRGVDSTGQPAHVSARRVKNQATLRRAELEMKVPVQPQVAELLLSAHISLGTGGRASTPRLDEAGCREHL